MNKHNTPRKGLTLVEMLLAISLAMGLMASMLWFYHYTAEVRDTVTAEIQQINARRRVMERITKNLRGAMTYPFLNIGLEGRTDSIRFMTTQLPDAGVWVVQDVTEKPVTPQQDVHLIGYQLRIEEDEEEGASYIVGIEMTKQNLITAVMATAEDAVTGEAAPEEEQTDDAAEADIESTVLSPFVGFVRFRFWDGSQWLEQWPPEEAPEGLPLAVEVALGAEPLPEEVDPIDYPYEVSIRVVYLPAATPMQGGNIIRGLSGQGGL